PCGLTSGLLRAVHRLSRPAFNRLTPLLLQSRPRCASYQARASRHMDGMRFFCKLRRPMPYVRAPPSPCSIGRLTPMLDALQRGAQAWPAKILFLILMISFGVFWNVSDVFQGPGRGAVAKVGDTEITAPEFQRAFQNQLRSVQLEDGGRLTAEQGLMLRLDRQALDTLIAQAAVKAHADKLGLALSDQTLVEGVMADPDFHGPDGKFSRNGFEQLLRQIGLTEQGF